MIYSIVGQTLMFTIPAFLIFALFFHLVFIKMITKPTVNLFRTIMHKKKI